MAVKQIFKSWVPSFLLRQVLYILLNQIFNSSFKLIKWLFYYFQRSCQTILSTCVCWMIFYFCCLLCILYLFKFWSCWNNHTQSAKDVVLVFIVCAANHSEDKIFYWYTSKLYSQTNKKEKICLKKWQVLRLQAYTVGQIQTNLQCVFLCGSPFWVWWFPTGFSLDLDLVIVQTKAWFEMSGSPSRFSLTLLCGKDLRMTRHFWEMRLFQQGLVETKFSKLVWTHTGCRRSPSLTKGSWRPGYSLRYIWSCIFPCFVLVILCSVLLPLFIINLLILNICAFA